MGGVAGVTYDNHWSALAAGPGTCSDVIGVSGFSADIRVTKTASPAQLVIGDVVTFALNVSNNGPSNATGVIATDSLPPQVSYLGNTCGASYAAPVLTWSIGNLAAGSQANCSVTATVVAAGTIENVVVVTGNQIDPVTANNSATVQINAGATRPVAVPTSGQGGTLALLSLMGLLGLLFARRGIR